MPRCPRSGTRRLRTRALALLLLAACGGPAETGPADIHWSRDTCEHCQMAISDPRHAAQVRDARSGRVHLFDDLGCALLWLDAEGLDATLGELWVGDPSGSGWLDGRTAAYAADRRTPMGYGFAAAPEGAAGVPLETVRERVRERERERRSRHP